MHCPPLQYITRKKIERAQLLMIIGKKSIKDIAHDLSFSHLPYFYRVFKKITGLPPGRYLRGK
jgi:AraC-like DNA-binding protein